VLIKATAARLGLPLLIGSMVAALPGLVSAHAATAASTSPARSVTSFLSGYFHAMDRALMPGSAAAELSGYYPTGRAATQDSRSLLAYEVRTADGFHSWVQGYGDIYKSIVTSETIKSMTVSASGQRASADVATTTTMRWSPGTDAKATRFTPEKAASMAAAARNGRVFGVHDTVTSMVSTNHLMVLIRQGGAWKVQSDLYFDPFDQALAPDHTTLLANVATGSVVPAAHPSAICPPNQCLEGYEGSGAAAYADRYALHYNTDFVNCNVSCGGGGDCTNFVSQSISFYGNTVQGYGGKGGDLSIEHPYWQYWWNGVPQYTLDWDNAADLHSFVTKNPYGSAYDFGWLGAHGDWSQTNSYDKSSMSIGDLHFYDWNNDGGIDHSAIAVAYLGDGTTLVDAHNTDSYHVRYDFGTTHKTSTRYYMDRMHSTISSP